MGLMNFLAGPLGSIAAGAADTLTDNYWNNVLPNDEKAAASFKEIVLKKKAARANAIATGNAINSRLTSQARALATVEGFEEHSMADLIATIKMVEDSGLAKEGDAVAAILKNEDLKYTIKPASTKSKEPAPDVKEQTSMALGTPSGTSTTPEAESRSAFQIMMHGKGSRGIQDSVLKEMGMTRKDFEDLSNPVVRKRLNIGESAIKLAVAKKISPGMQAFVKQRQDHALSLQKDLGPKTITDYISPVTKLPMTVSQLTYYIVSALDKDPNDPTANEYRGILDGMSLKKVGLEEVANNAQPTIESAVSFINDKKQNEEAKAEARALHKELNTLTSTLGRARNSEEMLNLQEKIIQVQGELNLIIGRAADELNSEMPVLLSEIDKMDNIKPMQLVDGVPFKKAVTDLKIEYANLQTNYTSLSTKEIQEKEQELIQKAMKLNSVMPIEMPKTIEETHAVIMKAFDENKLSGEIEVKPGETMPVQEYVLKVYGNAYQSMLDGKAVDDETIINMHAQILSTRPLEGDEKERLDAIKRFTEVVTASNSEGGIPNLRALLFKKGENALTPTQKSLVQQGLRNLVNMDNEVLSLRDMLEDDGSYTYTNEELDKMFNQHAINRKVQIMHIQDAALFEGGTYEKNVANLKETVENTKNILRNSSQAFDIKEHNKILALANEFDIITGETMGTTPEERMETLAKLGEIVSDLIVLGRKADLPAPTALDEKVEAMVEAEKQRRKDLNTPMNDIEIERAKVNAKGMLVRGNAIVTKDGTFLQQPDYEKGSGIQLIQVPPLTAEGNLVAMDLDQLEKNDEAIKASLMGESTTGNILKTFMTHSNAFNAAGSAQLFGVNASDLFNSMTGADIKPLLGGDKEDLAEVQKARTDAFTLIDSARKQLFGGDSRLSDLDLRTLNSFLVVLESNNFSLVGTTRGQAALGIIQAAMTKDAMLREKDADFDNKLTIAESFEAKTSAEIAKMSKEQKLFYEYEKKLGFKIGPNSGESLAKTAFYRILRGYGIPNDRLASREEGLAMTEPERNLYKHKINFAIQQMEYVMSDFYVYVANGVEGKDKVVNQMLQNYKDKFK